MKRMLLSLCFAIAIINSNAQTWSPVGTGLNGTVNALHTDSTSNRLYATGTFTGKVAFWDGSTWNVVPGYPGHLPGLSITTYHTDSLLGPYIKYVVVGSDSIYVYNGSTWTTVQGIGTGAHGISNDFGFYSLCTYLACNANGFIDFVCAGGKYSTFNGLVELDPNNSFNPTQIGANLGIGTGNKTLTDIKRWKDTLYLVGPYAGYIGKFTAGNNIVQVPTTTVNPTGTYVNYANVYGNEIYFSGVFSSFGGALSPGFIGYTGSHFVAAYSGSGPWTGAEVMQTFNGYLYTASSSSNNGMQIWNGTSFSNITSPIGQTINCMGVYNGELYAGGNFTSPYSNIAKYNDGLTTAINKSETSNLASVYPNPTSGKFVVNANGEATIDVYNCLGQSVLHVVTNDEQTINIDKAGVYFIRVLKKDKILNSTIIIQ